jgi:hypothetical protein
MRALSKLLLVLPVALIAVRCQAGGSPPADNAQDQTLKLDNAHSRSYSGTNQLAYQIWPAQKIYIDVPQYIFDRPGHIREKPPTDIDLIGGISNSYRYTIPWEHGKTRYEISRATLHAAKEVPAFEGFESKQQWTLRISDAYETNVSFSVSFILWSGIINVQ